MVAKREAAALHRCHPSIREGMVLLQRLYAASPDGAPDRGAKRGFDESVALPMSTSGQFPWASTAWTDASRAAKAVTTPAVV